MSLANRHFFEECLIPAGQPLTGRPVGIDHMIKAEKEHLVHMESYAELRASLPTSEYAHEFLQGMLNAMAVSYHKYGRVKDAYPHKVDALKSLRERITKYLETGNTEYLIDVANFAMIEFMCPHLPGAHYTATDADGSPGRISAFTNRATQARNTDIGTDAEGLI